LIGSAQARRKAGILQHGALPLYGDLTRIIKALSFPNNEAETKAKLRLLAHATTVEKELGFPISWDQANQAFKQAFQDTLNLVLEPSELTSKEKERAEELLRTKYGHPSWTERI
jgi:lipoate-protein ligase A